ncbi:PRD domain-containing protein [Corynebacterium choanae]|uniref:PRD domain-containing protein n=1 Tax=Corynebacterium choanae TaxID=1862358 RepID=UPI0019D07448|nr:PRD domain-containing protein [Corynebacterium choanae]
MTLKPPMQVIKRLNNNAVVVATRRGEEAIVTGKGVGFGVTVGGPVDQTKIEKLFSLAGQRTPVREDPHALAVLAAIDPELLSIAQHVLDVAAAALPTLMTTNVLLPLADHLQGALHRARHGNELPPLLFAELAEFYPEEFQAGLLAVRLVNEQFAVRLTDAEAAFVALHIINASNGEQPEEVSQITHVIREVTKLVEQDLRLRLDPSSLSYQRFITHLKFFIRRLVRNESLPLGTSQAHAQRMLEEITTTHPRISACSEKIRLFLLATYDFHVEEAEGLYLAIHLARLIQQAPTEPASTTDPSPP